MFWFDRESIIPGNFGFARYQHYIIPISVCRWRERGHMSKSVYVRVFHDLELLRYVLRCAIEQQLSFPAGMNKVYCYCQEGFAVEPVEHNFISDIAGVKPVLNRANVCSPNILRTVQRTMIRFLIELLVHRTWFGQFREFTCSQLACNEMQASAQTCSRHAADSMIENVG